VINLFKLNIKKNQYKKSTNKNFKMIPIKFFSILFSVILFISIPNGFHSRHARRDIFNARHQRGITPMPEEMDAAPENGCILVAAAGSALGGIIANAVNGKRAIDVMNNRLKKRC
jgi:hypothetical protein